MQSHPALCSTNNLLKTNKSALTKLRSCRQHQKLPFGLSRPSGPYRRRTHGVPSIGGNAATQSERPADEINGKQDI
jgi:hypothetical protein